MRIHLLFFNQGVEKPITISILNSNLVFLKLDYIKSFFIVRAITKMKVKTRNKDLVELS